MIISKGNDGAHWYSLENGVVISRNTCMSADGKKEINTTLRQARTQNFMPSVTSILMELKSLALEKWKMALVAQACTTIDRLPEEGLDSFVERAMSDFDQVSDTYKEYGRRAHGVCEQIAKEGRLLSCDADLEHIAIMFWEWLNENAEDVLFVEKNVSAYGYAGCMDLAIQLKDGSVAVVDIKTQRPKVGKPFAAWESYGPQLAAYADALAYTENDIRWRNAKLINLMVSNDPEVHRIEVIEHSNTALNRARFMNTYITWCMNREYFPQGFNSQYTLESIFKALP